MSLASQGLLRAGHRRDAAQSVFLRPHVLPFRPDRRNFSVEARSYEAGIGMFGTKCGMRSFYAEDGSCYGCTIIGMEEGNIVAQVKTKETDGYDSIQVGYRVAKEKKVKKPVRGHLSKYSCPPMRKLREFKLKDADVVKSYESGKQLKMDEVFNVGDLVDVAGVTIGKGFQGTIKRWHHKRGPMTHGSKSKREHGSISCGSASPSRVFPGMKMAGRMGNKRTKIRKLEILAMEPEVGYLVVKGSVPGKPGNVLEITPAKIVGVTI